MSNNKIFFYNGKPPFYFIPLVVIITLVLVGVLAVFGFFVAIAVGVVVIVTGLTRFLSTLNNKKVRKMDPDGKNIILDDDDYEIIEPEDRKS